MAPSTTEWARMKDSPATSVVQLVRSRRRSGGRGTISAASSAAAANAAATVAKTDGRSEEIEHAAERRAGERSGLVDGRVPGDGVAEILARHEQRQQRLLGRVAEGARRAGERDEAVDRQGRVRAQRRKEHEPGGRKRGRGMGDEHDQAAVEGVRDVAGHEHERERRDEG